MIDETNKTEKPRKCGMFWLAILAEAWDGEQAAKDGKPRVYPKNASVNYPELEAAWFAAYDFVENISFIEKKLIEKKHPNPASYIAWLTTQPVEIVNSMAKRLREQF